MDIVPTGINPKVAEKAIAQIYKDLAAPGVKQAGKAIATAVSLLNVALTPVTYLDGWSQAIVRANLEKLRKKLQHHPERDIIPVPPELGVPIIEKLFYISDDDLSSMFVNLLKRASISDEAHLAHPSFVNRAANLSPDEARIIHYSKGAKIKFITPFVEVEENTKTVAGYSSTMNTWRESRAIFTGLEEKVTILFPQNMYCYLTNLFSLGIVDHPSGISSIADDDDYLYLKKRYEKNISAIFDGDLPVGKRLIRNGEIEFTQFGQLFINAVCDPTVDDPRKSSNVA